MKKTKQLVEYCIFPNFGTTRIWIDKKQIDENVMYFTTFRINKNNNGGCVSATPLSHNKHLDSALLDLRNRLLVSRLNDNGELSLIDFLNALDNVKYMIKKEVGKIEKRIIKLIKKKGYKIKHKIELEKIDLNIRDNLSDFVKNKQNEQVNKKVNKKKK